MLKIRSACGIRWFSGFKKVNPINFWFVLKPLFDPIELKISIEWWMIFIDHLSFIQKQRFQRHACCNLHKPAASTHAIFLDLKKAFDTVDHSILAEKLWRMGFGGPTNTLLKSYLTKREHKYVVEILNPHFYLFTFKNRCSSGLNFGTITVYLVCKRSSGGYSEPNNDPLRRWHIFDTTQTIKS